MTSILDVVLGDENFSILADLITAIDEVTDVGLAETLGSAEFEGTVFAPTNDALISAANALGYPDPDASGATTYLIAAANALTDGDGLALLGQVVAYHVSPFAISPSDIFGSGLIVDGPAPNILDANAAPLVPIREDVAVLNSIPTLIDENITNDYGKLIDLDPDSPDAMVGDFVETENGSVFVINQLLLPIDVQVDVEPTEDADLIVDGDEDGVFALLGGDDVFSGGAGDDYVEGNAGDDLIHLGDGNDTAHGGKGDDRIEGQAGNDQIWGYHGDDRLDGDQGNDSLNGGSGDDFVQGGSGNDRVAGNSGDDTLVGGIGNDLLLGRTGDDDLRAEDGDDRAFGGIGDDLIRGGAGDDSVRGDAGDDSVYGGLGDDRVSGNSGDDFVSGGFGDDVVYGRSGDDTVHGDNGDDRVWAHEGDDKLGGGAGNDSLNAGAGDDLAAGNAGDDRVAGNSGDDTLYGGSGNDTVLGEQGSDELYGGGGDDILNGGGEGNDVLTGGKGADVFGSDIADGGKIEVMDYDADEGDTLDISGLASEDDLISMLTASGDLILTADSNPEWTMTVYNYAAPEEPLLSEEEDTLELATF